IGIFGNAYDDHDLETLNSPYADQSVGVEADFNNMEPSTIVSPIPITRVHSIHPKSQIIRDPKSAVQTRGMTKKNSESREGQITKISKTTYLLVSFLNMNPQRYLKPLMMKVGLKQCKKNCFSSRFRSNQEPFVNPSLVPMADNRTMAQLLQAPTEGYEDAIVILEINANFELKHGLINLVQNKQFLGHDKEDPHAHIRYFNKITSTMRFSDVPSTSIKLMHYRFPLESCVVAKVSLNSSTPGISPDVVALTTEVYELKNLMKTMLMDKQKDQVSSATDKRRSRAELFT
ncbi:hypothetical protein Tco_1238232, partial [Tanacetum coccineum]